jgi:hypothetical protein
MDETAVTDLVGTIDDNGDGAKTKTLRYIQDYSVVPILFIRMKALE